MKQLPKFAKVFFIVLGIAFILFGTSNIVKYINTEWLYTIGKVNSIKTETIIDTNVITPMISFVDQDQKQHEILGETCNTQESICPKTGDQVELMYNSKNTNEYIVIKNNSEKTIKMYSTGISAGIINIVFGCLVVSAAFIKIK